MAGSGNRSGGSGRGAGGRVSAQAFQQASSNARARAGRMDERIARRIGQARATAMTMERTPARGRVSRKRYVEYRKANTGLGTAAFARDQRSGRVSADGMARAREARVSGGRASRRYMVSA